MRTNCVNVQIIIEEEITNMRLALKCMCHFGFIDVHDVKYVNRSSPLMNPNILGQVHAIFRLGLMVHVDF